MTHRDTHPCPDCRQSDTGCPDDGCGLTPAQREEQDRAEEAAIYERASYLDRAGDWR